jgi:hypothetical protein
MESCTASSLVEGLSVPVHEKKTMADKIKRKYFMNTFFADANVNENSVKPF